MRPFAPYHFGHERRGGGRAVERRPKKQRVTVLVGRVVFSVFRTVFFLTNSSPRARKTTRPSAEQIVQNGNSPSPDGEVRTVFFTAVENSSGPVIRAARERNVVAFEVKRTLRRKRTKRFDTYRGVTNTNTEGCTNVRTIRASGNSHSSRARIDT